MGGKTVFSGSLSFVVRLTFQTFDQYHSDSQELFQIFFPFRHNLSLRLHENKTQQYNLCVGTVIDRNWIVTSATCCKRDQIVTIKFNNYSIFFPDEDEHEIVSTRFYIHQESRGAVLLASMESPRGCVTTNYLNNAMKSLIGSLN